MKSNFPKRQTVKIATNKVAPTKKQLSSIFPDIPVHNTLYHEDIGMLRSSEKSCRFKLDNITHTL